MKRTTLLGTLLVRTLEGEAWRPWQLVRLPSAYPPDTHRRTVTFAWPGSEYRMPAAAHHASTLVRYHVVSEHSTVGEWRHS